jgi:hypothetical protein
MCINENYSMIILTLVILIGVMFFLNKSMNQNNEIEIMKLKYLNINAFSNYKEASTQTYMSINSIMKKFIEFFIILPLLFSSATQA